MPDQGISRLGLLWERLIRWEYWPFALFYFPVFFYYLWLVWKCRSFFFFTAANPKIEFGGMFGEKKSDIYSLIPKAYLPDTYLIKKGDIAAASKAGEMVGYPLIAKPNIGERGTWVSKIDTPFALAEYTQTCPVDFLIQEWVDMPLELGVFYVRLPGEAGRITSIVRKGFLTVCGDGKHTLMELLNTNKRARINADFEADFLKNRGNEVLSPGEELLVEPIGNHCRGTTFYNDELAIDADLEKAINQVASAIPDFHFGRFDLKCRSYEDLKNLKHFKILELNGAGSEPGHIYQPGYPLFKAYKDVLWHLKVLADISLANKEKGVLYWSFKEGYNKWQSHKKYNRLLAGA